MQYQFGTSSAIFYTKVAQPAYVPQQRFHPVSQIVYGNAPMIRTISNRQESKHDHRSSKASIVGSTREIKRVATQSTLTSPFAKKPDRMFKSVEDRLRIRLISCLGRGRFSEVHLAVANGFLFAIKMIKKSVIQEYSMQHQLVREIYTQQKLNHPHIVKIYGSSYDQTHVYLMLEYCGQGELFQLQYKQPNRKFPEKQAAQYIQQTLQAIEYMHQKGFMHCDLKTENILLSMNEIKICDLGCAHEITSTPRRTFCGTVDYIAPEVISGEYDEKCDVWQVAILAFELVHGMAPFTQLPRDDDAIMNRILNSAIPSSKEYSIQFRDFIQKGLQKNPKERVTISVLLQHQWLAQYALK